MAKSNQRIGIYKLSVLYLQLRNRRFGNCKKGNVFSEDCIADICELELILSTGEDNNFAQKVVTDYFIATIVPNLCQG